MENKDYAPVIIPTLCRYEHFKRCIESLEKCTGAENTDVYVALDYPANNKQIEGWKKIDIYLNEKETNNIFRNLIVKRRSKNCGVDHSKGNFSLLYQEIKLISNKCIVSEDDNEFAPCFLEYMNEALEKYENDERIIDICGYSPIEYPGRSNIYFAKYGNAWGHGFWIKKKDKMAKIINLETYKNLLLNYHQSVKLFIKNPFSLNIMLNNVIMNQYHGDGGIWNYCIMYDKYSMFPSKSLVKNWGNDGSGVHTKIINKYDREISIESYFKIDDIAVSEDRETRRLINKLMTKHWYGNIAILIRYFIWRITKKDLFEVLKKFGLIYNNK